MADKLDKGIVKIARFSKLNNRINYYKVGSEAMEHVISLERYVRKTKLDRKLKAMIKVYASQINGCPFCLEMHTKEAKKLKISNETLESLNDWRTSKAFEDKEKAALELTEHITNISEYGVKEDLYQRVRDFYNEKEYFDLVTVINQINYWNRLAISMGNPAKKMT
ncbi:carboxymuconolactone decarboxylase family protein [Mammaliicoccus sciuri]|uniref:carboxymuconolactone decarboxylase family protein n=2 Tax=Mammaliicoccus sciuri TaxID=1296 RepID=UPI002DBF7E90|nr:carboxymuconolactone decarboxylase family protein [Mammaliicoccus sciuri]MEB5760122.1 carboxymuconolactone decarboxylase family protein [Mammaliicoccus sciuri]